MPLMLTQRLFTLVNNFAGLRIYDFLFVEIIFAVYDSLKLHPLATFAVKIVSGYNLLIRSTLSPVASFQGKFLKEPEASVEFYSGFKNACCRITGWAGSSLPSREIGKII